LLGYNKETTEVGFTIYMHRGMHVQESSIAEEGATKIGYFIYKQGYVGVF